MRRLYILRAPTTGYLAVLRSPGVLLPAAGTALASLPVGMLGLSLLLLVRQRSDGFAPAGVVVAALGVGTVVGMVVQGRLIDRSGPRGVLLAASAVRAVASVTFVVVAGARPPLWGLAALAVIIGASEPQAGSTLRSLWPSLVNRSLRPTATALSSVVFELPVLAGPLLVAVAVAAVPVEVAILGAAALAVVGAWMVAWSSAAGRWQRPAFRPGRGPLGIPQVRLIIVVVAVQGLAVGVLQVSSAAAAATAASPGLTGLLYALLAAGSLLGTAVYGVCARPVAPRWQLPGLLAGGAGAMAVAAWSGGVASLAGCLAFFGLVAGPIGVRCFIDLERYAPPGSPAAATTMLIAAGLAATSAGSGIAGWTIDTSGTVPTLAVGAVCVLLVALWQAFRARPC